MQAIKSTAKSAVADIQRIGPAGIVEVERLARAASEFRDITRAATQNTLTPWGKFMSRKIEGSEAPDFEKRVASRNSKLTTELGRAPTQFEVLKGVAAGAGKSNAVVSYVSNMTRVLGPVMTVGQSAMVASHIWEAAPGQRTEVAMTEGAHLSSSLLYGSVGSILGVAAVGALLVSPVGIGLVGYAGAIYLAGSLTGAVAGSMTGGWVADQLTGNYYGHR